MTAAVLPWRKLHVEYAGDLLFHRLSELSGQTVAFVKSLYADLILLAQDSGAEHGALAGVDVDERAWYYRRDFAGDESAARGAVLATLAALERLGRIVDGRLARFARRQGIEPASSAPTSAAIRRRRRRARLDDAAREPELPLQADAEGDAEAAAAGYPARGAGRDSGRDSGVTRGVTHKRREDEENLVSVVRARVVDPDSGGAEPDPIDRDFGPWWADCEHKVNRAAAGIEYRAARNRGRTAAELRDGWRRYAAWKPPTRQWLDPATWLRDDRCEDLPAPWRGQTELLLPIDSSITGASHARPGHRAHRQSAHAAYTAGYHRVLAALERQDALSRGGGAGLDSGPGLAAAAGYG
jgi:hypothetical protein